MKKILSTVLAFVIMATAFVGILPLPEVSAAQTNYIKRYTVLILDTMGEYTITTNGVDLTVSAPLETVKEAGKRFISSVVNAEGDNYIAVVSCANTSSVALGFSGSESELGSAIDSLRDVDGFSDVNHAFELADELLAEAPDNAICNIVYFTGCSPAAGAHDYDGNYTIGDCTYKVTATKIPLYAHANVVYNTAKAIHEKGYSIYTLGCVTNLEEQPESYNFFIKVMNDIANAGYYDAANPEDLEFVFGEVAETIVSDITGTFKYRPAVDSIGKDHEAAFYYRDSYFFDKRGDEYNNHLATMSLCLELSSFPSLEAIDGNGNYDYADQGKNAVQLLRDIGFEKENIKLNDAFVTKPTLDTMGVIVAQKKIKNAGKEYTLVAVVLRGGGYEAEWGSNFKIGSAAENDGNHKGFYEARDRVLPFINEQLKTTSGDIKLWVTGFSRGGAVAGLVSAWYDDHLSSLRAQGISLSFEDIYTYTFEAPMSTDIKNLQGKNYSNIHNIINFNDLVTKVAMAGNPGNGWNFARPGDPLTAKEMNSAEYKKKYIPTKTNDSGYAAKKAMMLEYLRELDPDIPYMVDDFVDYDLYLTKSTPLNEMMDYFLGRVTTVLSREAYYTNIEPLAVPLIGKLLGDHAAMELFMEKFGENMGESKLMINLGLLLLNNNKFTRQSQIAKIKSDLTAIIEETLIDTGIVFNKGDVKKLLEQVFDLFGVEIVDIIYTAITIFGRNSYGPKCTCCSKCSCAKSDADTCGCSKCKCGCASCTCNDENKTGPFMTHYPELCLAWLMSSDSYYNGDDSVMFSPPATRIVRINCPVNVTVYDSAGNKVAEFIDDVVQDIEGDSLTAMVKAGEKTVYLPSNEEYRIEITATDSGTMSYSVEEHLATTGGSFRSVVYLDVPLTAGAVYSAEVPTGSEESGGYDNKYSLIGANGKLAPNIDVYGGDVERSKCQIEVVSDNDEAGMGTGSGEYLIGSRVLLEAYSGDCYQFEGWYENGEKVSADPEYQFVAKGSATYTVKFAEDHSADEEWIIDVEPQIGVAGEKHLSCKECGAVLETAVIDPLVDEAENDSHKDSVSFIDAVARKIGVTSVQLIIITAVTMASVVFVVVVVVLMKRSRR